MTKGLGTLYAQPEHVLAIPAATSSHDVDIELSMPGVAFRLEYASDKATTWTMAESKPYNMQGYHLALSLTGA